MTDQTQNADAEGEADDDTHAVPADLVELYEVLEFGVAEASS